MHNSCSRRAVHRSIERQYAERRRMHRAAASHREANDQISCDGYRHWRGRCAQVELLAWAQGL